MPVATSIPKITTFASVKFQNKMLENFKTLKIPNAASLCNENVALTSDD